MAKLVSARQLKTWLSDNHEIALLDVRELGQYGAGHPFFSIPAPYSLFEPRLIALVPNNRTRLVLFDQNDDIANKASVIAERLGYEDVCLLDGGAPAWENAGFTLFEGVNLPSKSFGELLEVARNTPHISATELHRRQQAGDNLIILDGRPFAEYQKMSIPGASCCPNGELALRIGQLVPDAETTIVINCAGRTRSILGAQTLIDFGVPNPVLALENGTQGWFLAGLQLENGADRCHDDTMDDGSLLERQSQAKALALKAGVKTLSTETLKSFLNDDTRTTYLLDVTTKNEFDQHNYTRVLHAPGGQLIQATDQWVGVRGARLVILDTEQVRAPVVANWLSQLGHETYIMQDGVAALKNVDCLQTRIISYRNDEPRQISAAELSTLDNFIVVDLRNSQSYRSYHLQHAVWCTRPALSGLETAAYNTIALVSDNKQALDLFVNDLSVRPNCPTLVTLKDDPDAWRAANLTLVKNSHEPTNNECIDFIFHTHDRHQGNAAAARAYLAWETGLVDQLDKQERDVFKISL
jgi:rhodanese-related sulfurtransferase